MAKILAIYFLVGHLLSYHTLVTEVDASETMPLFHANTLLLATARKQEVVKLTEQLIEAINTGDFETYT